MIASMQGVTVGYAGKPLLANVKLCLPEAEIVCLLGCNGSGKTSLLKTLLGLLVPLAGEIKIAGRQIHQWSQRELAQQMAYVPQAQLSRFSFRVLEMVLMGCQSRLGLFAVPGANEQKRALAVLKQLDIAHLADCAMDQISGGERQLVLIARALLQSPRLLVMDEPAASLDFGNQIKLLAQVKRLKQQGIAVLMSTHHPRHAELLADSVALVEPGHGLRQGAVAGQLQVSGLAQLYGVSESAIAEHL
ncbi:ABC transporter ATP-binding protein [Shewanella algae]|jgi:iron complex transport system ATP-binding protein|uniref:ABC transporter ATP-binding protein n=1 Tax=Shewanella algae TaxID=38313 RepID=UPI0012DED23B|nr:ABC transporter ATP-binding protein [Shewanella algae]QGS61132.1 ATP-binding cassette domain-containing protein [Shewanella algae]